MTRIPPVASSVRESGAGALVSDGRPTAMYGPVVVLAVEWIRSWLVDRSTWDDQG